MNKLIILCTHGKDNDEKANLAFVIATTAQAAETDARIFLATNGVWLACKGYADDIHISGHPPLRELMDLYTSQGGRLRVCTPCAVRRNISKADLIDGADLVGVMDLAAQESGVSFISL